ncbi:MULTISPECIES: oxidoreductase-like domain-containing protein [unclassified Acinetobacter]|uniref:oxidoreductase-like domain-containing protein n=1 Tax=unclassified Acinetobacter TaxID=196816 RepID=UPI0035BA080A
MTEQKQVLLEPPVPPEDWECCGSECGDYCVYEVYQREKSAYEQQQKLLAQQDQE